MSDTLSISLINKTIAIFRTDIGGRLSYCNDRFAQLLGYPSPQAALERGNLYRHLAPKDKNQLLQALQADSLLTDYRLQMQREDGETIHLLAAFSQADTEGIEGLLVDITRHCREMSERERALQTERNRLAHQVDKQTAALRAANAELDRLSHLKIEFLSSISHELRTPLNAILGMSEVLEDGIYGPLSQQQQTAIHTIHQSGQHLLTLINDMLDLSRIRAGTLRLEFHPVPVEPVCQASLRLINPLARQKSLQVVSSFDSQAPPIRADERRLKQILTNLLTNAIKFTPEKGKIGLEVANNAGRQAVDITVWDTGIGIGLEDMSRLFTAFTQVDSRLSRQYEGTGLGLALVARLVEMHGGGITLESGGKDQGSRFVVTLPWIEADIYRTPLPPTNPVEKTILLVENNPIQADILSAHLVSRGYRIIESYDGPEAIIQARQTGPDLILINIQLPHMDGLEAIRHLRTNPLLRRIPIFVFTSLAIPGDRKRSLAVGATEYLTKPINIHHLTDLIQTYLYPQWRVSQS